MTSREYKIVKAMAMKDKGFNEAYIAQELKISTSTLRSLLVEGTAQRKAKVVTTATQMKASNYSNAEIAEHMGLPESAVRHILAP